MKILKTLNSPSLIFQFDNFSTVLSSPWPINYTFCISTLLPHGYKWTSQNFLLLGDLCNIFKVKEFFSIYANLVLKIKFVHWHLHTRKQCISILLSWLPPVVSPCIYQFPILHKRPFSIFMCFCFALKLTEFNQSHLWDSWFETYTEA